MTVTPKKAAALFGAAFAIVFLMMHNPDEVRVPEMLAVSKWLVLLPAAFLLALRPAVRFWSSGLALTGGVFVGVCLVAILYESNIWPIAGVYWTWIWLPPIAVGSVAGMLVVWAFRGARR